MRHLLRTSSSSSSSCDIDERKVNIFINGTRVQGCVHSDAEYKKRISILLGVLIPVGILICVLWCYMCFADTCKQNRKHKYDQVRENKEEDELVQEVLGPHLLNFLDGHLTDDIKRIIGMARSKYGPMTNTKFVNYFRRHTVQKQTLLDHVSIDAISFEIQNIQPC